MEWYDLIYHYGLTIRTNLFGTTFYSLVGLHASHVIVGLIMLGSRSSSPSRAKSTSITRSALKWSRSTGTSSMLSGSLSSPLSTSLAARAATGRTLWNTTTKLDHNSIHMPAPTAWPMVLALGVSLIVTGMVTSGYVSLLGLVLTVVAVVGWFCNVLPIEAHEFVDAKTEPVQIRQLIAIPSSICPSVRCTARSFPSKHSNSPPVSRAASPAARP